MDAKLVVVGGDAKAAEVKLKLPAVIGRGRDATLTLPHPLVSRKHCEISESDGYLLVRDMGSLNGTFVNNERVTEAVLPPGDLLTLGTVTFRAVYDPPSSDPPEVGTAQADVAEPEIGLAREEASSDVAEPEIGLAPEEASSDVQEVQEVEEAGDVLEFDDFEIVELDDGDKPTEVPDV
jgi:predicted component of type VI protein secretion system